MRVQTQFDRRRALAILLCLLSGCTAALEPPDLGRLYNRSAMSHERYRNPVIVIPGILGTRLIDAASQQVVWGAFGGGAANPETRSGASLLALPMDDARGLRDLTDGIVPDGVLDRTRVELFGLPLELSAYLQILATLGVGGYRDELLGQKGAIDYGEDHYTCFQFDYDWRRDNVENAARLHAFLLDRRAYVQERLRERFGPGDYEDVKFDLVAHSMGGLVTRYFLRYGNADLPAEGVPPVTWAGTEHVERAILIGTPNTGSAKAILQLVEGARFAAFLPTYAPAILGTMPSIYQLMPRTRHQPVSGPHGQLDLYDPQVWQDHGWGLASPAQDRVLGWLLPEAVDADQRAAIARAHQARCLARARQFHLALDQPASPPPGVELHIFASDALDTPATLKVTGKGRLEVDEVWPGDGTVLRSSALADERIGQVWRPHLESPVSWRTTHFLFNDHIGMTRDPIFSDNVLYLLLEAPRSREEVEK